MSNNAKVVFGPIKFEIEVDEDFFNRDDVQTKLNAATERFEAAIAEAMCKEIRTILPEVSIETTDVWIEREGES